MAFWNIQHILNKIFDSATSALNIKVTGSLPAFAATPTVDTELPAAAALADAAANPTTPTVGAALKVWNGTAWDNVDGVNTGQLVVTLKSAAGTEFVDTTGGYRASPYGTTEAIGDGRTNSPRRGTDYAGVILNQTAYPLDFNETTWDRRRNNTVALPLTSASRTATTYTAQQTLYNGEGLTAILHPTAKAGTTTLNVYLQFLIGAVWVTVAQSGAFAAVANTLYVVSFRPGILDADYEAVHVAKNVAVVRDYRLFVDPSDADSVTYQLGTYHHA